VPASPLSKSAIPLGRADETADLAALAEFQVTINSVVGAGSSRPEDAYEIALRARSLGFTSTAGVVHDEQGQVRPLGGVHRGVVDRILRLSPSLFSFAQFGHFQENIIRGLPNHWRCRAGGRFLYICEHGLVHFCSQRRGQPGIPLGEYSAADLVRQADLPKPCAPFCTVSCVHQVAMLDRIRERPKETLAAMLNERKARDPAFEIPRLVRLLTWIFLDPRKQEDGARAAFRLLGMKGPAGESACVPARSPIATMGRRP